MRFDLPDPFDPITTLIGPSAKRSMRLMLLNPSTVIQSTTVFRTRPGPVHETRSRSACAPRYGCSPALSAASLTSIARAPDSELGIE